MLKKILLSLLGLFLLLSAIVMFNAQRLGNTQLEPGNEIPAVDWDRDAMLDRFSRAIQFLTISGDDSVEKDSTQFFAFLEFIEEEFPLVHQQLDRKMFNELTPLYFWEGADTSLDPILLMGHYDVVPIDSTDLDGWNYGPFSGEVAEGYLWGRGTLDNKNNVMALLETAEYMLSVDYRPNRGIYFLFGHDEEIGGTYGAKAVADYFREHNISLDFVLDEGGIVINDSLFVDSAAAMIGIAEKGYISLELVARTAGGHSSQPPDELAVHELSRAITALVENQFPARIDGAVEKLFDSVADLMNLPFRIIYGNRWATEGLMTSMMSNNATTAPMVRTTIAPTMLRAGVKDNVLPIEARAVINFRILPGETFETVKEHVERAIDNELITIREYGSIRILPSPVSSVESDSYQKLSRAIMDHFRDIYITPYLVTGATDSRYFTDFTDQVYRFSANRVDMNDLGSVHGTNERINADSYTSSIDFYNHFIRLTTE